MRIENVPNPGTYSGSQQLRVKVAHAISAVENAAYRAPDGKAALADNMYTMFAAAAAAVQGYRRSWYVDLVLSGAVLTQSVVVDVPEQMIVMALDNLGTYHNVTQTVEYEAYPDGVVSVSSTGLITGEKVGTGTIRATIRGGKSDAAVTREFAITVTAV